MRLLYQKIVGIKAQFTEHTRKPTEKKEAESRKNGYNVMAEYPNSLSPICSLLSACISTTWDHLGKHVGRQDREK
jgi:hypothetical protein